MIRLHRYIYIHILTVVLFIFCWINRTCEFFFASYAVMTLHELAHLAAALFIGLRPAYIVFYPFGVNLRLLNKIVYSFADEMILYSAGITLNGILSVICLVFFNETYWGRWLYYNNLLFFFMNLLPILPLDGGILLKKILCRHLGEVSGTRIIKIISAIIAVGMAIAGIYAVYRFKYNFSILFLSAALLGNLLTQKEKYRWEFLKELMFYKRNADPKAKTQVLIAGETEDPRQTAKRFRCGKNSLVFRVNTDGKIKKIQTDQEIIGEILGKM